MMDSNSMETAEIDNSNQNDLLSFLNGFEDQLKGEEEAKSKEEDEEKSKRVKRRRDKAADQEVNDKRKKVKKQVRFKPETIEAAAVTEVKRKRKRVKNQVKFKPEEEVAVAVSDEKHSEIETAEAEGQWLGSGAEIALNNWLLQISYVELNLKTCKSLQLGVDESLDRMRMDGPLSYKKLDELRSISKLWRELIELLSCYNIGIVANKRRIIEILLRLYTLKQISTDIYLDTVLQL